MQTVPENVREICQNLHQAYPEIQTTNSLLFANQHRTAARRKTNLRIKATFLHN